MRNVDMPNLADQIEEPRLVLQHVYAGQAYADLKPSGHEPNQGFFWDEDALRAVVNDLYPYPRDDQAAMAPAIATTLHAAGLETLVEDRRGNGLEAWALCADALTIAEAIAEHDAAARAAGKTPAQSEECACLRDLASLAGEKTSDMTAMGRLEEGASVVLQPERARRVRLALKEGRVLIAVDGPEPGRKLGYESEITVGDEKLTLSYDYHSVSVRRGGTLVCVTVRD